MTAQVARRTVHPQIDTMLLDRLYQDLGRAMANRKAANRAENTPIVDVSGYTRRGRRAIFRGSRRMGAAATESSRKRQDAAPIATYRNR